MMMNRQENDHISRQAAIESFEDTTYTKNEIRRRITELPSAQPERKTGRWIAHVGGKFVGFPYMHYECDQCRAFKPTETNFCPDCGADMRGEE